MIKRKQEAFLNIHLHSILLRMPWWPIRRRHCDAFIIF